MVLEMILGSKIEGACRRAHREIFIAAPFIKRQALQRLVSAIPEGVPLTVVVRFLPIDIASGVTDPEIVDDLLGRKGTKVLAQPALHAKIYRVDDSVFVGSANLTNRALGWSSAPNVEILIEVAATHGEVRATEELLMRSAYPLTPELVSALMANLPKVEIIEPPDTAAPMPLWIPACRRPSSLWEVYSKGDASVIRSVIDAAKQDLDYLQIAPSLPRAAFQQVVKAAFKSSPFYQMLEARISQDGLSDTEGPQWLRDTFGMDLSDVPSDAWANVKEWLREYCSDKLHFSAQVERITTAQPLRWLVRVMTVAPADEPMQAGLLAISWTVWVQLLRRSLHCPPWRVELYARCSELRRDTLEDWL